MPPTKIERKIVSNLNGPQHIYYAHNSKKNTVEIRLQLLGESVAQKFTGNYIYIQHVEEELTKSADYEA
jgi:hypothetical protein